MVPESSLLYVMVPESSLLYLKTEPVMVHTPRNRIDYAASTGSRRVLCHQQLGVLWRWGGGFP